jgi:uncharacterized protein (TIGR01777 family)
MRVLVSGSSGLVGRSLDETMHREGHTVLHLVRPESADQRPANGTVRWNPPAGEFDAARAEGADAVVHLAGASIADGRWTEERKRVLRSSRVDATRHLVGHLAKLSRPPRIFVAASAVGYFGDRGDEVLTENSAPANDFLGKLCQEWEAESLAAEKFGARVVLLRFGIILAAQGGALAKMLPPFRMGVGGPIGSGRQWMSWISLPEVVGVIHFALQNEALRGPVNTVAPNPVTNKQFSRALGGALRRPAIFPLPGFVARTMFGEMADALLLASQRVAPQKLQQAGYSFHHAELDGALRAVLKP